MEMNLILHPFTFYLDGKLDELGSSRCPEKGASADV